MKINALEREILRRLLAGVPLCISVDRPEDRARQRLRRKGMIVYTSRDHWRITELGRELWRSLHKDAA